MPPRQQKKKPEAPICKGIVAKTGKPCRFKAKDGSKFCGMHGGGGQAAKKNAKLVAARKRGGECDVMIAKSVRGQPICKEIRTCAQNVRGAAKNSASPTDIWFVSPKDKDIGVMVMKIYISPETAKRSQSLNQGSILDRILSLDYERRIYSKIIKPLVSSKRCKNFIFSLGEGVNCTFDNLLSLLETSTVPEHIRASVLHRNIFLMRASRRPAITDTKITPKMVPAAIKRENESYRYNYTLLTAAPTDSVVFADVNDVKGPKPISRFLWDVLFQVYFAIYALSLSKLSHQDLHEGNVFVRRTPPTRKTYCINNKLLTTVTTAEAYIYDFDRAYCERLGNNAYISFDVTSQRNTFTEKWDVIKPLTYIYDSHTRGLKRDIFATSKNKLPDPTTSWKQIMDLFVKKNSDYEQNADYMHQIFTNGYFLQHPKDSEDTVRRELEDSSFNTPLEVLEILATIVGVETTPSDAASEKAGILNARDFASNGALRVASPSAPSALTGRNVFSIVPQRSAHIAARENYIK